MSELKLCLFGDSIGKGIILPDTGRYQTAKLDLCALTGRSDITLTNYSMFGCTITKALAILRRHLTELPAYDTVLLEFGGNDCDFDWDAVSANPTADHACKTPLALFEQQYAEAVALVRETGAFPVMFSLPPLVASRYFAWVSHGKEPDRILQWLGEVEYIYRWQELYNLSAVKLAGRLRVPLIDIRCAFLTDHHYENLICADGIHPNERGHALIYRTAAAQYRKLVSDHLIQPQNP